MRESAPDDGAVPWPASVHVNGPAAVAAPAGARGPVFRKRGADSASSVPVFTTTRSAASHKQIAAVSMAGVVVPSQYLIWQNTQTGERALWKMNGTSYTGQVTTFSLGTQWDLAGAADFNADASDDLVWQNTVTGERVIWLMHGTSYTGMQAGFFVGTDWDIAAVADFEGDVTPDIVWQNRVTGERAIWRMAGTTFTGSQNSFYVNTNWDIAAAANFAGAPKTDIVWQNLSTGERAIWEVQGGPSPLTQTTFGVNPDWKIAGAADMTGDGQADLIWEHNVTRERTIWHMQGPDYSGTQTAFNISTSGNVVGAMLSSGQPSALHSTLSLSDPGTQNVTVTVTVRDGNGDVVPNATPLSFSAQASAGTLGGFNCTLGVCTATYIGNFGAVAIQATIGGSQIGSSPLQFTHFIQVGRVTAGWEHTCVLANGGAYCWGKNDHGQLGDGTTTDRSSPVLVSGGHSFRNIFAGGRHTCGVTWLGSEVYGRLYCWGAGADGQINDGAFTDRLTPTSVGGEYEYGYLSAGYSFTCGSKRLDEFNNPQAVMECWGTGAWGELTLASAGVSYMPAGGFRHSCGIGLATYCAGSNVHGALGNGTTSGEQHSPTLVSGNFDFRSIASGDYHTCAITSAGQAYCWGLNIDSQLGDGTTTNRLTPTAVGGGITFAPRMYSADYFHPTIAAAAGSTCAIAASGESPGRVYCWGLNNHGQLGDGTTVNKTTPVPIASNLDFWMLSARYGHACAIKDSGGVLYCWGRNTYGQLGIGTTTDRNVPTRVGLPPQ